MKTPARRPKLFKKRAKEDVARTLNLTQDDLKQPITSVTTICQIYASSAEQDEVHQVKDSLLSQRCLWMLAQSNVWSDDVLALLDVLIDMSLDHNWNFLVQHLVALCNDQQLSAICSCLRGCVTKLARNNIGCRVLCRICEQAHTSLDALELLKELSTDLLTHIEDANAIFVIMKILENFTDFPGLDEVLQNCASRPQKSRSVLHFLAEACDLNKLKPMHFEAILSWPGFEDLQFGRRYEQIIYESALLYSNSKHQKENLNSVAEAPEAPLCLPTLEMAPPSYGEICCTPVYVSVFDPHGTFMGFVLQGYNSWQTTCPRTPLDPTIVSQRWPRQSFFDSKTSTPKDGPSGQLTWEVSARNAKRLCKRSPTVLHLGKRVFQGNVYGLDLATSLTTSTEEDMFYHASLKLLDTPSSNAVLLVSFEVKVPLYHNFSQNHVCVSPPLTIPLKRLWEPQETLNITVNMRPCY